MITTRLLPTLLLLICLPLQGMAGVMCMGCFKAPQVDNSAQAKHACCPHHLAAADTPQNDNSGDGAKHHCNGLCCLMQVLPPPLVSFTSATEHHHYPPAASRDLISQTPVPLLRPPLVL